MNESSSRPLATFAIALLLAAGLAGCVGSNSGASAMTFDEARAQAHTTAEPTDASPLRLGLLEPTSTEAIPQGITNVSLVLWDQGTGEPVTDANITLDARMPAMGHGAEPETDPTHLANGVYRGSTNLMMGGQWVLELNVTRASGATSSFAVPINVTGSGGMGAGMDHGHSSSTTYSSYEDARNAQGPTFEPREDSTVRLKLLDPSRTEGLEPGKQNVSFLVFDGEADEPVTSGNATLNASMPAMGHGTSPEQDPVHLQHGVWQGSTNFAMNGTWVLNLDLEPENGSWLHWDVNVSVGNGSMSMDHGEMSDEPAFEPYTERFEDDVSSPNYTRAYDLEVKGANATLTLNATLENATPLADELTVSLLDPDGEELGSVTLSADASSGQLAVDDAPAKGTYTLEVHGQAVQAHYVVEAHVAPP